MIHWLPLEPLAERYTEQMHRWVASSLQRCGQPWRTVTGTTEVERIAEGEWLDTTATCAWKTEQVLKMTAAISAGAVNNGDVVLVGDAWFPGIETLKFQCDLLGVQVAFAGWHHAGCFDPNDYLARSLGAWGRKFEAALLEGVFDYVCFGSEYHCAFVERNVRLKGRAIVAGQPWNHTEVASSRQPDKRGGVVFNHRWAKEKRWQEFVQLRRRFPDEAFVFSTSGNIADATRKECDRAGIEIVQHDSKSAYYRWLSQAGVVWSGADQETFGYSVMEAIALGVPVVAPNRLAYGDHLRRAGLQPEQWLYGEDDLCGHDALANQLQQPRPIPAVVSQQYQDSAHSFVRAVLAQEEIKRCG